MQFIAVEIARNKLGLNDVHSAKKAVTEQASA
jgi:hypothetical protein